MHTLLSVLTVSLLTMFSTSASRAEDNALVVIAADQSNSMFDSGHVNIQREALITAFANYLVDCNNLEVRYIAWGGEAIAPVSAKLTDQAAVIDYANRLWPVSHAILQSTNHHRGVEAALKQLNASDAKQKVLIFTTDGLSNEPDNWNLGRKIPADVLVFTISLGSREISDFVSKNIQPATGGKHYHANNADELTARFEEAFTAAKTELCLS